MSEVNVREDEVYVHEAGHVVTSHALGATIIYVQKNDDSEHPLGTGSDLNDLAAKIKVSLGGLMAETAFLKQNSDRLFGRYEEMIRIRPKQPDWNGLSVTEEKLTGHARTDLQWAFVYAGEIMGADNINEICELLKTGWNEVHEIIERNGQELEAVAADIKQWSQRDLPKHVTFDGVTSLAKFRSLSSRKEL
jgi:hypothetical protein